MKKIYGFTLFLIITSFLIGFVFGVKNLFPYKLVKSAQNMVIQNFNQTNLEPCLIPKLSVLPDEFSVLIGHAYGSPEGSEPSDFIASNVLKFLEANDNSIEAIIFTGDVFAVPSSLKWKKLYNNFGSQDLFIAPGNHDTLRLDSNEVFQRNKFIRQDYPFKTIKSQSHIILTDSISNNWKVSKKLTKLIKEQNSEIFIARHNVVASDLLGFANSSSGFSEIPTVHQLVNNLDTEHNVTWIMGDGGAFANLPRITCHKYKQHRFVINGIGEISGDTILILHEGNLYQFTLV